MKFSVWEPVSGLAKPLYLEGLYDDYEGFRLLLRGGREHDRMLRIKFDSVLSYRSTDEGDLINARYEGLSAWSLYTVEESSYVAWFNDVSYGIHESDGITHYAVYTPVDCVDILSAHSPEVVWLS